MIDNFIARATTYKQFVNSDSFLRDLVIQNYPAAQRLRE